MPLKVELANGRRGHSSSVDRYSSYSGSGSSRGIPRHSDYRGMCCLPYYFSHKMCMQCSVELIWLHHVVLVTGLPPSASWQDLKVRMNLFSHVRFNLSKIIVILSF
jgi:arginine/serine-rich splicing factor 1/9